MRAEGGVANATRTRDWLLLVPVLLTLAPVYLPTFMSWLAPLPESGSDPMGLKSAVLGRLVASVFVACLAQAWFIASFVRRSRDGRNRVWFVLGTWVFAASILMVAFGGLLLATGYSDYPFGLCVALAVVAAEGVIGMVALWATLRRTRTRHWFLVAVPCDLAGAYMLVIGAEGIPAWSSVALAGVATIGCVASIATVGALWRCIDRGGG